MNNIINGSFYTLLQIGLFAKDYIGTEIHLPKGNKDSANIKIDAVIFDSKEWFLHYENYHKFKDLSALAWLREHIICVIEFKKENAKNIEEVYDKQLKAYMKESERDFCLGILYDTGRLFLFKRQGTKFLRFSQEFNAKGDDSKKADLNLNLPDPYLNIPSFDALINLKNAKKIKRDKRSVNDLSLISGLYSTSLNNAMFSILHTLDSVSLVNQKGYSILIQILALKIYDEKHNKPLRFYVLDYEQSYKKLSDANLQEFLKRISSIYEEAKGVYKEIFKFKEIDYKDENLIKVLICIVKEFQDYSFVNSHKSDLYQLIFHRFASEFAKGEKAQFLTPLPLIDFLVQIVNPRNKESVIDPTVGIADFLSVAYVNSKSKLEDKNIFGMDVDNQMISLATLNMLLNGDGNATLKHRAALGSILHKFSSDGGTLELDFNTNKGGSWEERADDKQLKLFDVVLTNPPFGEKRSFEPKTQEQKEVIQCYQTWEFYKKQIDLGVVFLENAYRILKTNGRFGIVLSNSIASIETHKKTREWLMDKMRIVAIFDLPANTFAETGVNVSMIVAYKPEERELERLKRDGYNIFIKSIENIGYEIKTINRIKHFVNIYKINNETFELEVDANGRPKIKEEFTQTIAEFRSWCNGQEETLRDLFIKEK